MIFFKKRHTTSGDKPSSNEEGLKSKQETPTQEASSAYKANSKATNRFIFRWKKLFSLKDKQAEHEFYTELEELLIEADVGGKAAIELVERLRQMVEQKKELEKKNTLSYQDKILLIREMLVATLKEGQFNFKTEKTPTKKTPVVVLLGVNGVGKTTTLAKLAHLLKQDHAVVIGAGDTFRAAATEQLEYWANKIQVPFVSKGTGADAAAVAYDTVQSACAKQQGLALIDTAGRLHNQQMLINELEKLFRVLNKFESNVEVVKLLVMDMTLGQNVWKQAKTFHETLQLDGLLLTKLDTEARGGTLLTIAQTLEIPIYFYTFGEALEDIAPFNKQAYVDSLLPNID